MIADIFNSYQDYLVKEQDLREEIRTIVRKLEKCTREMVMTLQNIHKNEMAEENIIVSKYCAQARKQLENVRQYYGELAEIVPKNQYYRFNNQWRQVTQRLCFLVSLIIYLEIKTLATKDTVAEILGVKSNHLDGFHVDLEDFLMGLLEMASELTRFAVNSVTFRYYERPVEIARFLTEMNAGFCVLNFKNDALRRRYDNFQYDVKKIEEVVYDLTIRGLKPTDK